MKRLVKTLYSMAPPLFQKGHIKLAILILKPIQDAFPPATRELLNIYHYQIKNGDKKAIQSVANMYQKHNELENICVDFCKEISDQNNEIAIEYASALYGKGLKDLSSLFIDNARKHILANISDTSINSLTNSPELIDGLVKEIFIDLKNFYNENNISKANLLASILYPYYRTDEEFLKIYYSITIENLSTRPLTPKSIETLGNILLNARKSLPSDYATDVENRILNLSKSSFTSKDYVSSLLLSHLIWEAYAEAQTIYKESAYNIFCENTRTDLVDVASLNMMFGEGETYINEIERFVKFDFGFKGKYKEATSSQLCTFANDGNVDGALSLLVRACKITYSPKFFHSIISNDTEKFSKSIVNNLVDKYIDLLSPKERLEPFVEDIMKIPDAKYIVDTLETLLKSGLNVEKEYTSSNIAFIKGKEAKEQITILNKALTLVGNDSLINAKHKACSDYIKTTPLGDSFIVDNCKGLIGKHPEAEILLATIDINRASDKSCSLEGRDASIREAISFKSSHSPLFSKIEYEKKSKSINAVANEIAKLWFSNTSLEKSVSLLYYLRDNKFEWYETYVDLYISIKYKNDEEATSTLRSVAMEGKKSGSKALKKLFEKLLSYTATAHKTDSDSKKLVVYNDLLDTIHSFSDFDGKDSLVEIIYNITDKIHLHAGHEFELHKNYSNAIKNMKL